MSQAWTHVVEVTRRLREAGHEAFLAGGCVRDRLLGRQPKDYDVVTSARPDEVQAHFPRTVPVGAKFGVILVLVGDERYEVATFRSDGPYDDGRRPREIAYAGPEADARRRDFTINGLFLDPEDERVIDYVEGRADLEAGIVRAIGDPAERFAEDRLRLLRAVRFAASLGFTIEERTLRAIQEAAPTIESVAKERVREEIARILTEGGAARGFRLLRETGLLAEVLPEVDATVGVEQPAAFHPEGDVWTHILGLLQGLDAMDEPGRVLAFGALLHDVGKPPTQEHGEDRIRFDGHASAGAEMAGAICRRLRLSRAETEGVVDLVRSHMSFLEVRRMRPATLRRFLVRSDIEDHLELHRLDCEASHGDLGNLAFCRDRLEEIRSEPDPLPRLLTGHDLIDEGFSPGPLFAKILTFVEEAQIEHRISTREAALRLVRDRFGDPRRVGESGPGRGVDGRGDGRDPA